MIPPLILFVVLSVVKTGSGWVGPLVDETDCVSCHGITEGERLRWEASRIGLMGKGDRGVGVVDKGEVSNVHGNFGLISDFHFFAPALHWPANGSDIQQYGFGVGLFVAVDGNVISSYADPTTQVESFDWEAKDGSRGELFASVRTENNTASDGTPFLAHSDIIDSWPGYGSDPQWPGRFRVNVDSTSASFGEEVEGEFTSDRDIFGVFTDAENERTPLGISVTQTTYAYDRPYAEDFFFLNFWIKNASGELAGTPPTDYEGVYVGLMADIKNDFNNDDLIGKGRVGRKEDTSEINFIFEWDSNGIAENTQGAEFSDWTGPVAYTGIGLLKSPDNLGITDFHYFDDSYSPIQDEELWPILTSDPNDANIDPSLYFHGPDVHIDHDSLSGSFLDPDPSDEREGADITFIFSTGPFDLSVGDSVNFAVLVVMGEDSTDLFNNAEEAAKMALDLHFQGSNPPATPRISAVAGDEKVTVFWNAEPSESSRDIRTGEKDFEGYRLYRSTDRGRTWGDPITDSFGKVVGYVPIAQFDKVDSIVGIDPVGGRYLGDDSGLSHSYLDTDLINGFEYWYCITAYDQGVPDQNEPSYENGLGRSTIEAHVVSVTPGVDPTNLTPGGVSGGDLQPIGGPCQGTVRIQLMDPSLLTGHEYEITFNDSGDVLFVQNESGDGLTVDSIPVTETTMNLFDLTDLTSRFTDANTGEMFDFINLKPEGDNLPVVDGFRIFAEDIPGEGVSFMGWTLVHGDTCTFDWFRDRGDPNVGEAYVAGFDDFMIEVSHGESTSVMVDDGFGGEYGPIKIPIKVYVVTEPESPIDASQWTRLLDYEFGDLFPDSSFFGPEGWDLEPGGKGYNGTGFGDIWPDELQLLYPGDDSDTSAVDIRTQNGPDQTPPSDGDRFTIRTYKPFRRGISYRFQPTKSQLSAVVDLDAIKVVPNPYIVTAAWEQDKFNRRIQFNHLPSRCSIDIYTVAGDHVVSLSHNDESGYLFWDLKNKSGQNIAYGLYIYVVKTPEGKKRIGKFLVIK